MPRANKPTGDTGDQLKPKNAPTTRRNGAGNGNGGVDDMNSSDKVARRAYEIYQSRGGQHGSDLDHWLEAERELKPGPTSVTGSINTPKPKKARKTPEAGA
jgi:hypothetical protein